jgi:hypothetical protein
MQLSLNLQAALLARAVFWSTYDPASFLEPFDFLERLDYLEEQEFWLIVRTVECFELFAVKCQ